MRPRDVKPGEVWAVEPPTIGGAVQHGEWVAFRNVPSAVEPWRLVCTDGLGIVCRDDGSVLLLHRLVPARTLTRDDLPSSVDVQETPGVDISRIEASRILDAVVAHINAAGGVPDAEAAAPFTATRDEIEQTLHAECDVEAGDFYETVNIAAAVDALVELQDDPAVLVVRESAVQAVEVTWDAQGQPWGDAIEHWSSAQTADDLRSINDEIVENLIRREAVARAVEERDAEVEAQARALAELVHPGGHWDALIDEDRDTYLALARAGVTAPKEDQ